MLSNGPPRSGYVWKIPSLSTLTKYFITRPVGNNVEIHESAKRFMSSFNDKRSGTLNLVVCVEEEEVSSSVVSLSLSSCLVACGIEEEEVSNNAVSLSLSSRHLDMCSRGRRASPVEGEGEA